MGTMAAAMRGGVVETWRARDLVAALVRSNLRIRYRRTALGFFWSLLNPVLMMVIFTVVFSVLLRFGVDRYPLFFLSGFLPWGFLAASLTDSTNVLPAHETLIRKARFPRLALPVSAVLANFVHFLLSLAILLPFLLFGGVGLTPQAAALPLVVLLELLFVTGLGLCLATVNVFCRDVGQLLGILLMAWMYVSPVFYPTEMVPVPFTAWYRLNPMVTLLELYRCALLGQSMPTPWEVGYVVLWTAGLLTAGLLLFTRWEPEFAKEV